MNSQILPPQKEDEEVSTDRREVKDLKITDETNSKFTFNNFKAKICQSVTIQMRMMDGENLIFPPDPGRIPSLIINLPQMFKILS